jgi:polyhydroxyalkanoate synthesis repressor PhaR
MSSGKNENMDKKILIKKYENRRLYDVTHSRYVNLDEVARAVQDGYDVQVLDASTGEDITRLVMTQIITESAKTSDSVFPLDILREMVVASGKASQESASNYMRAVADMYKNALRGFSHTMTPFEIVQNMMNASSGAQTEPAPPEPAPESVEERESKTKAKDDSELKELKKRIQELEALVLKSNKAPSAHKKKVRS